MKREEPCLAEPSTPSSSCNPHPSAGLSQALMLTTSPSSGGSAMKSLNGAGPWMLELPSLLQLGAMEPKKVQWDPSLGQVWETGRKPSECCPPPQPPPWCWGPPPPFLWPSHWPPALLPPDPAHTWATLLSQCSLSYSPSRAHLKGFLRSGAYTCPGTCPHSFHRLFIYRPAPRGCEFHLLWYTCTDTYMSMFQVDHHSHGLRGCPGGGRLNCICTDTHHIYTLLQMYVYTDTTKGKFHILDKQV